MSWLTIHIWFLLLLAALFGGLIGWALRRYLRGTATVTTARDTQVATAVPDNEYHARIAELETQLRAERDEVASLRSSAPVAVASPSEAREGDGEGSVEWRNRYLESRVRYLEKQAKDLEMGDGSFGDVAVEPADEDTRLVWRNRYLQGRVRYLEEELLRGGTLHVVTEGASSTVTVETAEVEGSVVGVRPPIMHEARDGVPDDLKEIAGVGPKLEQVLNKLGIYHFSQIANWSEEEIAWVNGSIGNFKGRVERENWVEQAKQLAQGVETDGKRKYKEGKHT